MSLVAARNSPKPAGASHVRRGTIRHPAGVALVEFAFVLPIVLVLAMGMLDFGRAFHMKSLLDQAAREGARVAVVTSPDPDIVSARVNAVLASGGITPTSVLVSGPDAARMVTVTVNATFQFVTPGIFALIGGNYGSTIPMAGQTVMRFEG